MIHPILHKFYHSVGESSTSITSYLTEHSRCQTIWGFGTSYSNEVGAESLPILRELVSEWKYSSQYTVDYQNGNLVLLYANGAPVTPYAEHQWLSKDDLMHRRGVLMSFDILCDQYIKRLHGTSTLLQRMNR